MLNLTKSSFENTIAKGKVLVDFYTDWCGHCRVVKPVLEELEAKYINSVTVAKVDADNERDIANRYGIKNYPTIVLFEDGKEIAREIGAHPLGVFEKMIKKEEKQ